MLGLAPHRLLPGDAEPGEVLVDRLSNSGRQRVGVDILDAQQEPPAHARAISKSISAESA